ncbi:unnamed protein product [Nezara viridula]|uniref:Uncharacterized protein n=1 Tax=Nezara viridula TaxID=85310 RepID=A0A9P0H7J8_NEZVI|nr:unnamed protein product [Nezara viridula]
MFSAEEKSSAKFEAELQLESLESEEDKKAELLSAVQKIDMNAIFHLILKGALKGYHPRIYEDMEKKNLDKISVKLTVVELLLKMGIVAVLPQHYNETDEKLFNVTLIQGTDLVMTLMINVSVVKTWNDETLIKSGKIPLFMICALPDVSPETVRIILEAGTVGVDFQGENNITALMIASTRGNLDVVKFLVERGANINNTAYLAFESVGKLGERFRFLKLFTLKNVTVPPTVIHTSALSVAVYEDHQDMLEYLIKCGADVNVMGQGWAALNNAASIGKIELLKILLQNGIDVNSKDLMGATALHAAAKNNDTESAKLLLQFGANVNATDEFGWTPLHVAAFFSRNASKAMLELLLASGADINATTDGEFSPLNLAEAGHNLSFLDYLVRNHDVLNSAIEHSGLLDMDSNEDHAEVVSFLLNQGADLNHQDSILGWTALHWATSSGDLRVTRMLVEQFGAAMTSSKMGMTPFGTAKHFGRKSVVDYFIGDGETQNINDPNHSEKSDSSEARREELFSALQKGEISTVKRLIEEGDLEEYYHEVYGEKETTILKKIKKKVEVVSCLLELKLISIPNNSYVTIRGSNKNLFNVTLIPGTDLSVRQLVNLSAVMGESLVKERTALLHHICSLPDIEPEVVKTFLDYGTVDIDAWDHSHHTPLIYAVLSGNLELVKFLIQNGAKINKSIPYPSGMNNGRIDHQVDFMSVFSRNPVFIYSVRFTLSAVLAAAYENQPEVLQYLFENGGGVSENDHPWFVLFKSAYKGHHEVVEILIKNGIDVNSSGPWGSTTLHRLAETGNIKMAKLLLRYGAGCNWTNNFRWTPLHVAALYGINSTKLFVELLLDSVCDINALTDGGFSPLNLAVAGINLSFLDYLRKNRNWFKFDRHSQKLAESEHREGHTEILKLLLNRGADLNHQDNILGWTSLHWAAANGDLRGAKLLVEEYGAAKNLKSKMEMTPSSTAEYFGRDAVLEYLNTRREYLSNHHLFNVSLIPGTNLSVSRLLVNLTAAMDVSIAKKGYAPLHQICSLLDFKPEVVKIFLDYDTVEINTWSKSLGDTKIANVKDPGHHIGSSDSNETRRKALVSALQKGEISTVEKMIEENVLDELYHGINEEKKTTILKKIKKKVDVISTLLQLQLVSIPTNSYLIRQPSNQNMFNVSLIPGTDLSVRLLVNLTAVKDVSIANNGYAPLHQICSLPDVEPEVVKIFLDYGTVEINTWDKSRYITALINAVLNGNLKLVKFLVENGADINNSIPTSLDNNEKIDHRYDFMNIFTRKPVYIYGININVSAVLAAAYGNQPKVLRYLLEHGGDMDINDGFWFVLFSTSYNGYVEVVEILLKNGIDVNSKGPFGSTTLHRVAEIGNTEMAKLLLMYGADSNLTNNYGWTPLHVAALFGSKTNKSFVELLLDSGCDVNALTDGGFSPLNLAEAGNDLSFLEYLAKNFDSLKFDKHRSQKLTKPENREGHNEILQLLLNGGADLDHQDDILGWTTLHWASANGDLIGAKLLVEEYGAATSLKSKMVGDRKTTNIGELDHTDISDRSKGRRGELVSALRKGEITAVERLIEEGILEEYYHGIYEKREVNTLKKIRVKLDVLYSLLHLQLLSIPTDSYVSTHPSDHQFFTVTLIPGTDLSVRLLVNLTAVKDVSTVKKGYTPLHQICSLPDVEPDVVKIFLEYGTVKIDDWDNTRYITALINAVLNGNLKLVKFLVENDADINNFVPRSLMIDGRTDHQFDYMNIFTRKPVFVSEMDITVSAVLAAAYRNQPEILRYLLENGGNMIINKDPWFVLFRPSYKGHIEVVKILLENGIDVNSKGPFGSTTLHRVAETGNIEIAKLLLMYSADSNLTNNFNWTPLHVAALFGINSTKSFVELFLYSGCDVNALTDGGFSPLNLAEAGNDLSFLDYLVNNSDSLKFDKYENQKLAEPENWEGHYEILQLLLNRGAELDHQDDILGWTTLHWAAANGDLIGAKLLVEEYGAATTLKSKMGMTPFRTAQYFGRDAVSEYLSTGRNLVE